MEPDNIPMYDEMNQGIAPLVNEPINFNTTDQVVLPKPRQVLSNVIKNQGIDYIGRKIGVEQLGQVLGLGQYLGNVFGLGLNPVSVGIGALAGGIRNRFNNYKFGKSIARESRRDLQDRINKGEFGSTTPTPQDQRRGGQYTGGSQGGGRSNEARAAGTEAARGAGFGGRLHG